MDLYVIRRYSDKKFAAPYGSEQSYTPDVLKAKLFTSPQAAARFGVCGNEEVVRLIAPC